MISSTIVPTELSAKYKTVAEALLDLSEDDIGQLRLNAPMVCIKKCKTIVPLSFVVTRQEGSLIGVREQIINELVESDGKVLPEKLSSLFPPEGEMGFWDPLERFYRTRYMQKSAFGKPKISKELATSRNFHDIISYWIATIKGTIVPFIDTTIDWLPPNLSKPWAFEFTYPGNLMKWRISIGYRGCTRIHDYPFRASIFRRFPAGTDINPYDNLKKFVNNLIVEYVWCMNEIALHPNESESLIQHYKILPWTYMTDISYDINIAKAFACSLGTPQRGKTPALYRIVLLNIDYYDIGTHFLEHLPFNRPKYQNALSIIGLDSLMQDPIGIIVSLTEHPFYYDCKGSSWDFLGGDSFTLNGKSYDSLYLNIDEYNKLQTSLYPEELSEIQSLFYTLISKVRDNLGKFPITNKDKKAVLDRFIELEEELSRS